MRDAECLVPAAGRSERMGRWKPLLPFGGRTIVETVVATALQACPRVVLVAGYRGEELAALFRAEPRVRVVDNPDWPSGMFSSLIKGMKEIRTERFFVTLGDMPFLSPCVFEALLDHPAADAVYPVIGGRKGHPVLFRAAVKELVLAADPATATMRQVASRLPASYMEWTDDSILRDLDTPEDYAGALKPEGPQAPRLPPARPAGGPP